MRKLTCAIAVGCLLMAGSLMAADLKVGDDAPDFKLPGSDGKTYALEELKEKGLVTVVAWYPKAFTGG